MKPSLVPITCGIALALMAGASTAHWCSVRNLVQMAAVMPVRSAPVPAPIPAAPLPDDGIAREAKAFLAQARGGQEKSTVAATRPTATRPTATRPAAAPVQAGGSTDSRIERLLQLLEGTVEQNQELRDRIADTNRDLMELRFQVDSYDSQFRPLKVEEEPTYYDDGSAGVLPPLDASMETP